MVGGEGQETNQYSYLPRFATGFCYFCFRLNRKIQGGETIGKSFRPVWCLLRPLRVQNLLAAFLPRTFVGVLDAAFKRA